MAASEGQSCARRRGDGSDAALARCSCAEKQLAISAVSIGAAFGALVGGLVADRLGRRPALLASDVLFAGGGAAIATCQRCQRARMGLVEFGISMRHLDEGARGLIRGHAASERARGDRHQKKQQYISTIVV